MSNEESLTYVGTFNGKFTRRVPEGTEGAVTRTTKTGKSVTEAQFNTIEGRLTDIKERDSEWGKRWQFIFEANGQKLALESSQKSSMATTIINRLPNMDVNSPFKIKIVYNISKERTYFFISQNGEDIEDKYQKWDDKTSSWQRFFDYPAWEKVTVNGEEVWSATEQINFGKKVIKAYFYDKLEAVAAIEATPEPTPEAPQQEEEDSELPF